MEEKRKESEGSKRGEVRERRGVKKGGDSTKSLEWRKKSQVKNKRKFETGNGK
jgi:hypothetical protein